MTARLREIGMKESPVEFNESLYGALDETVCSRACPLSIKVQATLVPVHAR
jgi:hypothetical protein